MRTREDQEMWEEIRGGRKFTSEADLEFQLRNASSGMGMDDLFRDLIIAAGSEDPIQEVKN